MTPLLQIVSVPPSGRRNVEVGQHLELRFDRVFTIGERASSDVSTEIFLSGAADFEVLYDGRWKLVSRARCHAAVLNGRKLDFLVDERLASGDCLLLTNGLGVRFWLDGQDDSLPAKQLERLLQRRDQASWAVVADELLELNSPLGRWMACASRATEEEENRALGPLALAVRSGELGVEWTKHGFVRAAHFRPSAFEPGAVVVERGFPWLIVQWSRFPLARFLERLEFDIWMGHADEWRESVAAVAIEALRHAPFRDTVTRLSLGFGEAAPQALLDRFAGVFPLLAGDTFRVGASASLVLERSRSDLSVSGLDPHGACKLRGDVVIGTSPDVAIVIRGSEHLVRCLITAPVVLGEGFPSVGAWRLEACFIDGERHALLVNGQRVTEWALRPGDVFEPLPGLVFRFEWS